MVVDLCVSLLDEESKESVIQKYSGKVDVIDQALLDSGYTLHAENIVGDDNFRIIFEKIYLKVKRKARYHQYDRCCWGKRDRDRDFGGSL